VKSGHEKKRLHEFASIPAYMQVSSKDVSQIFGSFKNIFSSIWSSIKLLSNTLALNLKVLAYTVFKDQKRINEVFSEFATKRKTYDTEMAENLKYFKKNYSESRLDTLGGWGPGFLAFAANPLMFAADQVADSAATVSIPSDGKSSAEDSEKKDAKDKKEKPVSSSKISDRVKKAMEVFGFDVKRNISEAIQNPAPTNDMQAGQAKEQAMLLQKANSMLAAETQHAHELLSMLAGRPAVIKKIVEAKNFEEMIAAAAEGEKIKMGLSSQAFKTAYDNIVAGLKKESENDPEKFKKSIEDMRAKYPEIVEKDDIKAMTAFMFGTAKASIQTQAVESYNGLVNQAEAAMLLNTLDKADSTGKTPRQQLMGSDVGKKYLAMLAEFKNNLESGRQEMSAIAAKKV
jgi:hypothetical protein